MRVPKFRAYDIEICEMFYDVSVVTTYEDNKQHVIADFGMYNETEYSGTEIIDYKLMQFTGLLDKNGKEIFEGDVVEVFDSRYAVFYDNENASFRLKPRDKRWNTDYMSNYAHEASFEIIGDIYRNPELVEE